MIKLVLVDIDRALGTRDGKPLAKEAVDQLVELAHTDVRVAPMSQRGLREVLFLLGDQADLVRNAVLRSGSEVYCDGELLTGTRAASRLAGVRALMEILNLEPNEVVVLGGTDADAEIMNELPYAVATKDAATYARAAAKAIIEPVDRGGLDTFCQELQKAVEWGEEPSFFREAEEEEDSGLRAEFGESGEAAHGSHAGLCMVLGIVVVVAGFVVYLSDAFPSFASMVALTVGLLVGVALFYLGLSQRRDARKSRKAARHASAKGAEKNQK